MKNISSLNFFAKNTFCCSVQKLPSDQDSTPMMVALSFIQCEKLGLLQVVNGIVWLQIACFYRHYISSTEHALLLQWMKFGF